MNKLKYNSDSMKLIMFFESMSGAKVKDCISNEKLIFVIEENEIGKAIGRNGVNVKRIENSLKKKIKLVEFSNDVLKFVKNFVYPIELLDIKQNDSVITMYCKDKNEKAMLIGREHKSINHLSNIVKRHFNIREIKVI